MCIYKQCVCVCVCVLTCRYRHSVSIASGSGTLMEAGKSDNCGTHIRISTAVIAR